MSEAKKASRFLKRLIVCGLLLAHCSGVWVPEAAGLPSGQSRGASAAVDPSVDEYVQKTIQDHQIVGLALAVVRNGRVVKATGYGLANLETATPATADTVFKIGSISKQFIAAAILLLASEGKLSLADHVDRFLDDAPDSWRAITLENLLTHTSGLAPQQEVNDPPGFEPYTAQPLPELIRRSYVVPLQFSPGSKWNYSNAGYFVLAQVIEKASGMAWGDYMKVKLFKPLGMSATRLTSTVDIVPHRANGYTISERTIKNAENWISVRPSGALLSTVTDLAKWDAALYTDKPLVSSLRDRMWTAVRLSDGTTYPYGLGWSLDSWHGHQRLDHNGGTPGFRCDLERLPDDKLTVIVLTNTSPANPEEIALHVADLYAGFVR
jgi:D-alanyl-D-alanine carboxypeptidase